MDGMGSFLMVEYHKSSAAHAIHPATSEDSTAFRHALISGYFSSDI